MRKTLSLFTIIFFVFGIFVYGKSDSSYSIGSAMDKNGIVLGISEEAPNGGMDSNVESQNNSLPIDDMVKYKNLPPTKNASSSDYNLKAGKAVVLDCTSGSVIYDKNSTEKVAIASITKLATVLVFLKKNLSLDSVYEVKKEDRVEGGLLHLRTGDLVTIKDLLNLSLVSSDNMATMALVNASGMSLKEFVIEMNIFAKTNDLVNTNFIDAIGLEQNLSTAVDVAKLANLAFANETIAGIVSQEQYAFATKNGRAVIARSTNILLDDKVDDGVKVVGGKTGFTNSAGYCFVGKFVDDKNKNIISVVLDESEKKSRFYQARNLAKWAYDNFTWNN